MNFINMIKKYFNITLEVLFLAFGPAFILTALGLITGGILAWGIQFRTVSFGKIVLELCL